MSNGNSTTVKWIAIIVSIILMLSGWTFAGINAAKVNQIEDYKAKTEINTINISELKMQYGVVITKLEYIEKSIDEIKEVVKND